MAGITTGGPRGTARRRQPRHCGGGFHERAPWPVRDVVLIRVVDDGGGRPAGTRPATGRVSGGNGLVGMRERHPDAIEAAADSCKKAAGRPATTAPARYR
ncbi:hypothetical protein ACH40E_05110 [Streptomyces acidicola]|uniref:hypothetical protein n=1 Tax=Streptomyces acidicola TaxID=2596892 RepID=UPI0037B54651